MITRFRVAMAGIAGAVVAFGISELVHGLYQGVPSMFASLAQGIIKYTPGELVTKGIELLGKADIPTLISSMVFGALIVAAILANVGLRFPTLALFGVGALGVVGIAATFTDPFVSPVLTVLTIAGALIAGVMVTESLMRAAGLKEPAKATSTVSTDDSGPPETPGDVRSREAYGETSFGRGGFLALSGGAIAIGLAAAGVGRFLAGRNASRVSSSPKPLKLPQPAKNGSEDSAGESETGKGGKGEAGNATAVEHKTLPPPPEDTSIKISGMPELITPASSFYLIDTEFTSPRIDVNSWKLSVKGAVDNPVEFTYKDLLGMSTLEADITLSCVSNPVGGGLVSNGRWTGVLLSDVLAEAGVSRDKITRASQQLVGRSVDGFTTGFKTDIALDGRNALVAFGLNGNELPLKHGYPVRLVIPGLYGYVSATKWLTEIELTNWNFDAYWIQRTWSKEGPVKTQSRIDTVESDSSRSAGKIPVGGIAWAPHRGISRVEVSTDDGQTWNKARLAKQLAEDTWRQYVYDWDAKPGQYTIKVRATDGEGVTQTTKEAPPHPSGASGYHSIDVSVT